MTENNQRHDRLNNRSLNDDALDRELDAALTKFAAVEPRAGLEERVLANLRTERERAAGHSWWRWPAVAALAAVTVVALSVAWRSGKPAQNITTQTPPAPMQADRHVGTQLANNSATVPIRPHDVGPRKRLKPQTMGYSEAAIGPAPRLDQFPSPQPLSEQEKMLAEYVAGHHQQAILIARVRTAELKKDWPEEIEEASATSNHPTSDSPVIQQENR
jgi:hypothetical protein